MVVFLIILAVLAVLIIAICSLSATLTLVYEKGWHTQIQVLFIKKDIVLSEILSFLLFPEEKAKEVAEKTEEKKEPEKEEKKAAPKPNPIKKLWDSEGLVGMLTLLANVLDTANSAVLTLIRGLHIYSLYVMIIVGGYDAAHIGMKYGTLCQYYYGVKGVLLNQLRIDEYDDYIQPDFLAERDEYEFQLIASISVGLLLKVVFKAVKVFLVNLIKNKKQSKKAK